MVQQAERPAPQVIENPTECKHHWIIDSPTGPVSLGACRQCGEVREFKNYIESAPWKEDHSEAPAKELPEPSPAEDSEEPEDSDDL